MKRALELRDRFCFWVKGIWVAVEWRRADAMRVRGAIRYGYRCAVVPYYKGAVS